MYRKEQKQHTTRGLTLLGLLLYITITSGLLLAVGGVTLNMLSVSARANREQSRQYALSFVYARLAYDLGKADSISVPSAGGAGATLELVDSGTVTTYRIENNRLWMKTGSGDSVPLTPSDVVVQQGEFTVASSPLSVPPVRWRVQTAVRDPLRATVVHLHPTTTMTWYPYTYE